VETEPGCGTSIEVFFPAIESSTEMYTGEVFCDPARTPLVRPLASEVAPETNRKTILLVDDHPAARKSMQRFLLDAGYRILAACNGKEALKLFAEDCGAADR
jgi:PleD family two-component response regulator